MKHAIGSMEMIPDVGLHPSLRGYPGAVLGVTAGGVVFESNGRLEDELRTGLVGRSLEDVLDGASRERLRRLLDGGAETGAPGCELAVVAEGRVDARLFFVTREGDGSTARCWLVEYPRQAGSQRLHDQLSAVSADLVSSRREVAKKSVRLARALEEMESRLAENEQLSQMLQYQNEEMEAQNEELLAMMEELHAGQEELLLLNQQLEKKTRELQLALGARNRFYAAMNHELRTPINAVLGYNDLLLAGIYGPLNEQQELAVERAQRAVDHLRELVDDLLDLSKLETGRLEADVEPVSLRSLVEDLLATLGPLAQARGSRIDVDRWEGPDQVVTDPRLLRQILGNLLTNAIKYGRGRPVAVQFARDAAGRAVLEVVDNGEGIAADDLAHIFEEFVQLRPQPGGTGLGLPIARRLARQLGGQLEATSTPGVGSTFRLILPPAPPTGAAGTSFA